MTTWHIVTGEYPPAAGGVSDYSRLVAGGLAAAGDAVHVWCPNASGCGSDDAEVPGVQVHRIAGAWSAPDLHRLDREMDAIPGERKLLLQWVPHAYGKRSLNVRFCRWIRSRARAGDVLGIMVHEPALAFREGTMRQDVGAAIHRLMLALLLSHANRVWVAIPAWADVLRPWTRREDLSFCWLPIPSTLPVAEPHDAVRTIRAARLSDQHHVLVGHFSTYPPAIRCALAEVLPELLASDPQIHVELLGRGGERALEEIRDALGGNASRVTAPGPLDATSLSHHLQACDLLVQPYPDGASTRRSTLMAAMAHGVPAVTTIGRLSEAFWRESDAIAAAPAGDSGALARAAGELVRQPQRRRELATAARATYDARFSLPHVIAALRSEECAEVP